MTGDELHTVDMSAPGAELTAALVYLALLIYPGSIRQRDRFVAAALAYGVRVCRFHGMPQPAWASEVLTEVKAREQRTRLQKAHRILRRRLQAGAALQEVLLTRRSLTAAAKRSGGNRSAFMSKVWAESLPVLHLAWALHTSASWPTIRLPDGSVTQDPRPLLLSLIARPQWIHEAVRQGESKVSFLTALTDRPEFAAQLARYADTPKVRLRCAYLPTG